MSRCYMEDAGGFFESASKEELIAYLIKTIQNEVSKGDDEVDHDLVRECSDWLDELTEDEVVFTQEELDRKLEKLKAKEVSDKPARVLPKVTRRKIVRISLLVAAMLVISLMSLSAVAMNRGYGSAWDLISDNIGKMFDMERGDEINDDGITIIKNTGTVKYDNMDELLKAESLTILYPRVLPNKIKIAGLRYVNKKHDKYTLRIVLSDDLYAFDVSNSYTVDILKQTEFELMTCNGLDFYVTQKEEGVYFALLQTNGYEYSIKAPTYDDLLLIINNLKG